MSNKHIDPLFPVWCHKILPLVYDESLSYYENLCRFSAKLSEIIESQNNLQDQFNNLLNWINTQLKIYAQEILNQYLQDGSLAIDTDYDKTTRTLIFKFTNLGLNPIIRLYSGTINCTNTSINQEGDLFSNLVINDNGSLTLTSKIEIKNELLIFKENSIDEYSIVTTPNENKLTVQMYKDNVQVNAKTMKTMNFYFTYYERKDD